jgi:hypothetical protein
MAEFRAIPIAFFWPATLIQLFVTHPEKLANPILEIVRSAALNVML